MEEKHNSYKVEVALKATFLFSSKKPLTSEQLVKKFRKQKFGPLDVVDEADDAEFLYVISTEPVGQENDRST